MVPLALMQSLVTDVEQLWTPNPLLAARLPSES